jgi:hypothetical protein
MSWKDPTRTTGLIIEWNEKVSLQESKVEEGVKRTQQEVRQCFARCGFSSKRSVLSENVSFVRKCQLCSNMLALFEYVSFV